jgi:hypothetical protein
MISPMTLYVYVFTVYDFIDNVYLMIGSNDGTCSILIDTYGSKKEDWTPV